ncbi:hypothetical protein PQZ39_00110 [bacterium]|nr:hypothetical protein [bacterium]
MKVSHEVPRCLLTAQYEFNDYLYCLPHLLDQDDDYRDFFLEAAVNGDYIVMDNSLHELGEAYDHKRLLYWVNEIKPDEFIVPDVWMNATQTLVQAKHWRQFTYPDQTTLVAVVQGENESDALMCYTNLKDLGYKKIAFSYGASWYNNVVPHPNKDLGKALGRISFITRLYSSNLLTDYDRIHLLGCSVPQEFAWYNAFKCIESIDTSNPVMAALDGVKYTENGILTKPKANMNDNYDMYFDELDYGLVLHNTEMFRRINNIPIKSLEKQK